MTSVVPPGTAPAEKASCELADVFQRYGAAYLNSHRLTPAQRKAVWAITHCRTAALGGHREWCPACGFERYTYHSCRNRHCPKCQSTATAAWVAARQEELLPVPYFHQVFTLQHELNSLILYSERNQRALLGLLFEAAAQTLLAFGRSDLGGKIGFTLVLHTWDQHRHYGLLANRGKRKRLARCRELLGARPPQADEQPRTAVEWMRVVLGIDLACCPGCGGQLLRDLLPRAVASPAKACLPPPGEAQRVALCDSS